LRKKVPVYKTKTALRFWFAHGIEAEIPQAPHKGAAELERKARFPALRAGNAPKFSKKIFVMLNYWELIDGWCKNIYS
jgi:hypothetical protein